MKPEYRFEFKVTDVANDVIVTQANGFVSEHTSIAGENENVEMEIASAMRRYAKIKEDSETNLEKFEEEEETL